MTEPSLIRLHGLRVHGFHGVLAEERAKGQVFVVDAVLSIDTSRAATTDDLAETVDYAALAHRLAAVIEGEPVNLLETLVSRLLDECLTDHRVQRAEVTVRKPDAPVGRPLDDVSVTSAKER